MQGFKRKKINKNLFFVFENHFYNIEILNPKLLGGNLNGTEGNSANNHHPLYNLFNIFY